jgi:Ulp1 protease family, C-terminal catalytic domain
MDVHSGGSALNINSKVLDVGEYIKGRVCVLGDGNCLGDKIISIKDMAELTGDKEYIKLVNASAANPNDSSLQFEIMNNPKTIDTLGGEDEYIQTLIENFKVPAPQGNKLFSNFHEDLILRQLGTVVPTFKDYRCVLMDFYKDEKEPLTQIKNPNSEFIRDVKNGKIFSFGTIPNTLVSTGDTSKVGHWVALFGDFRDSIWTIEYYNSTGNNAPAGIFKWMEEVAAVLSRECNNKCIAINVSNIASQKGPTECGIYSQHYIICRLAGIEYKYFREDKIPDSSVNKLRKLFFDESKLNDKIKKVLRNRGYN